MLPVMKLEKIIQAFDEVANYEGNWEGFIPIARSLQYQMKELKERSEKIDALLIVAIVGGSGVGKSTLINAIAGDKIARTSEMRPCTHRPIIYYPPHWEPDLEFKEECELCPRSALENIVLIDTPDTDTIVREHRAFTKKIIEKCDLILLCGNQDKYLEEATWSIIREINKQRGFVLVETKMETNKPSIMDDWLARLKADGIEPLGYFRVNALRAFDRKIGIKSEGSADTNEFEFPQLEEFLARQLTDEKIRQIKTANIYGLLNKMIEKIETFLGETEPAIEEIKNFIQREKIELSHQNMKIIQKELRRETSTFYLLLKDEIGPTLHGSFLILAHIRNVLVNLLKVFSALRKPIKTIRGMLGTIKGKVLTDDEEISYFDKKINDISMGIATNLSHRMQKRLYEIQSQLLFALDKAQIKKDAVPSITENFTYHLFNRTRDFFAKEIDYHLIQKARCLSNYFLLELFYLPIYGVIAYILWKIIPGYFLDQYLNSSFLIHSCLVLAFTVWGSFWLYDKLVYFNAYRLCKKITRRYLNSLTDIINPFDEYERTIEEITRYIRKLHSLSEELQSLNNI